MLLSLLLMPAVTVSCKAAHSGVYMECARGQCGLVGDREVGWEFVQPEPFYMEREEEVIVFQFVSRNNNLISDSI